MGSFEFESNILEQLHSFHTYMVVLALEPRKGLSCQWFLKVNQDKSSKNVKLKPCSENLFCMIFNFYPFENNITVFCVKSMTRQWGNTDHLGSWERSREWCFFRLITNCRNWNLMDISTNIKIDLSPIIANTWNLIWQSVYNSLQKLRFFPDIDPSIFKLFQIVRKML